MIHYLLLIISGVVYYWLGYQVERSQFEMLAGLYAVNALIYLYWLATVRDKQMVNRLSVGAILLRAVFISAPTPLSDDVYRFIWDGKKILHHESPYASLPADEPGFDKKLFPKLNSPKYYSVYPPVNQLFFTVGGYFYRQSETAAIIAFRLMLILSEIIMLIFLRKLLISLKMAQWKALIYAANPLVIVEISGNLHFEGIMLLFVLLSFWFYVKKKMFRAGVLFALAVGVKLSVLLLLPYLFWLYRYRLAMFISGLAATCFAIFGYFLFFKDDAAHFLQSIDLYFHSFEFNASVYYIIRAIGEYFSGYNPIQTVGTWLGIVSAAGILGIYLWSIMRQIDRDTFTFCPLLWAYGLYLLLATTVHPWYVINLVFLSVFCYKNRFAVVWSVVAILSYSAYRFNPVQESPVLIWIEYIVVILVFVYDYTKNKHFLAKKMMS